MISDTLQKTVNDQIKHEMYSSYLYLSMVAHFEAQNLPGLAHWMRAQSGEETSHAMKLFAFLNDRGGVVKLQAIDAPPTDFGSPLQVFEQVLEHERKVTGLIHGLYAQAVKETDYASQFAFQWFVNEQVEEERNATQIVEQFKLVGDQGTPLFMIDRQLGARK